MGMVGLGRMGAKYDAALLHGGHTIVSFDRSPEAVQAHVQEERQESIPSNP